MKIILHIDREENLNAAKKAARTRRDAWMCRRTGSGDDIIDVVTGEDVIERHICRMMMSNITKRDFNVEEFALYR